MGAGSDTVSDLGSGSQDVATAGTAERLAPASVAIAWVTITARPGNGGQIAIGDESVDATVDAEIGVVLAGGDSYTLPVNDLSAVWVDASVSGEGVSYTYGVV